MQGLKRTGRGYVAFDMLQSMPVGQRRHMPAVPHTYDCKAPNLGAADMRTASSLAHCRSLTLLLLVQQEGRIHLDHPLAVTLILDLK